MGPPWPGRPYDYLHTYPRRRAFRSKDWNPNNPHGNVTFEPWKPVPLRLPLPPPEKERPKEKDDVPVGVVILDMNGESVLPPDNVLLMSRKRYENMRAILDQDQQ